MISEDVTKLLIPNWFACTIQSQWQRSMNPIPEKKPRRYANDTCERKFESSERY